MAWFGLVLAAYGTYENSEAQKKAASDRKQMMDYQAAVDRMNRDVAEDNAKYAKERGDQQAQIRQMQMGQTTGSAKAALAASGVTLDQVTPSNIMGDIAGIGDLDVKTIRNAALKEAYGYRLQGAGFGAQAALDEMAGANAMRAGRYGQNTSLISGASNFSDKWVSYRRSGVTNGGYTNNSAYSSGSMNNANADSLPW